MNKEKALKNQGLEFREDMLLDGVKNAEINCIIVKDFSRFARDYNELGSYLEQIFPFMERGSFPSTISMTAISMKEMLRISM